MKQFNTLSEMVEEYKKLYNSNCTHVDDELSTQDVIDVCVSKLWKPDAKAYGINVSTHTDQIEDFGYVVI